MKCFFNKTKKLFVFECRLIEPEFLFDNRLYIEMLFAIGEHILILVKTISLCRCVLSFLCISSCFSQHEKWIYCHEEQFLQLFVWPLSHCMSFIWFLFFFIFLYNKKSLHHYFVILNYKYFIHVSNMTSEESG